MSQNNEAPTEEGVAYADMSWQKLRALMAAESQEWNGTDQAVEYLTALDNQDADQTTDDAGPDDGGIEEAGSDRDDAAEASSDQGSEEDTETEDPEPVADEPEPESDPVAEVADEPAPVAAKATSKKTPAFDKAESYGEVFGSSKVRYHQGGHYFNGQGKYVPDDQVVDNEAEG